MGTRLSLVFICVVMTALAGCGGILTSGSSEAIYDTPLSAETVTDEHQAALQSAGTFTYSVSSTTFLRDDPSQRATTDVEAHVNLEAERAYVRQTLQQRATVEAFTAPEAGAFQRQQQGDQVRYLQVDSSQVNTTAFTRSGTFSALSEFDYEYQGAAETGGTQVYTYTARTDSTSAAALGIDVPQIQTVRSAQSQLNVTETGVIRGLDIRATGTDTEGRTLEYRTRVRYTDVGATTVQAPDWLGQAQNATT